jgi:hypothetical protein
MVFCMPDREQLIGDRPECTELVSNDYKESTHITDALAASGRESHVHLTANEHQTG